MLTRPVPPLLLISTMAHITGVSSGNTSGLPVARVRGQNGYDFPQLSIYQSMLESLQKVAFFWGFPYSPWVKLAEKFVYKWFWQACLEFGELIQHKRWLWWMVSLVTLALLWKVAWREVVRLHGVIMTGSRNYYESMIRKTQPHFRRTEIKIHLKSKI